jgi:hypothetical protein
MKTRAAKSRTRALYLGAAGLVLIGTSFIVPVFAGDSAKPNAVLQLAGWGDDNYGTPEGGESGGGYGGGEQKGGGGGWQGGGGHNGGG